MCGRYVLVVDTATLVEQFDLEPSAVHVSESITDYNVAPTKIMPIIVSTPEGRSAEPASWGLVPSWAKDPKIGSRMINARIETVAEKPAYRSSFARKRCLVPASGYYEWYTSPTGGPKQPFYVHPTHDDLFALAGLYAWWRPSPDVPWSVSYTIVTGSAQGELAAIHERVPMHVPREHWAAWLDPTQPGDPADLVTSVEGGSLRIDAVSTEVNQVRHNGPHLIEPIRGE